MHLQHARISTFSSQMSTTSSSVDSVTEPYIVFLPCSNASLGGIFAVMAEPDPWHVVVGQMTMGGDIVWVSDYIVDTIGSAIHGTMTHEQCSTDTDTVDSC